MASQPLAKYAEIFPTPGEALGGVVACSCVAPDCEALETICVPRCSCESALKFWPERDSAVPPVAGPSAGAAAGAAAKDGAEAGSVVGLAASRKAMPRLLSAKSSFVESVSSSCEDTPWMAASGICPSKFKECASKISITGRIEAGCAA